MALKFKYGSVEVVVKRATVADDLHAQIINQELRAQSPVGAWGHWDLFGELCSQTIRASGLPFDPVRLHEADRPALKAAYEAFLALDKALKDLWQKTAEQANKAVDEIAGPFPVDDDDPNG